MAKPDRDCGICILTGGRSTRLGRDKARLRLGSRTLTGHIRAEARALGLPVRTIRRDLVTRCGPLGGVFTGLKTSAAEAELFLACDMPFVSAGLLEELLNCWEVDRGAAFIALDRLAGFPFLVPVRALPLVERQISKRQFSLQKLAAALGARLIEPLRQREWELLNVNTPADWQTAQQEWKAARRRELILRSKCSPVAAHHREAGSAGKKNRKSGL